jgi:hypothetical protein
LNHLIIRLRAVFASVEELVKRARSETRDDQRTHLRTSRSEALVDAEIALHRITLHLTALVGKTL